jgi:S-formylglutathione hydrolase FrmB
MRRLSRTRAIALVAAALLATSVAVLAPSAPAGALPSLPAPSSHGITVSNWSDVAFDARLGDAVMQTDAVFGPTMRRDIRVRIYFPLSYDPARAEPYDVLYLLHGGGGDWTSWSNDNEGDIRDLVNGQSDFQGIVVMPEGGLAGFYSNWPGVTDGGFNPDWETFHVQQLVPWVDANFNTSGTRDGRVIAGLSMGGYGALRYAARHPDVFSAVGSFSGGTRLDNPGVQEIISEAMPAAGAAIGTLANFWASHGLTDGNYRVNRKLPNGDIDPNACNQRSYRNGVVVGSGAARDAVDPYALAGAFNAYDGRFGLYAGNGGDPDFQFVDEADCDNPDAGERLIGQINRELHTRLQGQGVLHRWCHGNGQHEWAHWRNELLNFLNYVYGDADAVCPNGWSPPT